MTQTVATEADLKIQLLQCLGHELHDVNQILKRQLRSSSDFVSDVTEHVSRFQGKQIRPMLLLLWEQLCGPPNSDKARQLAAAVEMIHMATLVHDDVIDESETRRHVATVHRRWNTETSVLFGDYLFSKSFHLAASTGDAEACRLIGIATDRTCEGELNQTAARLQRSRSEFDYFRIIRDKTGQLFSLSCILGARSANAPARTQRAAVRFGRRLGMAFQIADDVLDLTETQQSTGKDAGNDLQNGRLTLPILRAFASAEGPEKAALNAFLNGEETRAALPTLNCVNAGIQSARHTAEQLSLRAIKDLQPNAGSRAAELLEAIARFSIARRR